MQRSDQEARRRAIEVVLERRPDVELAELGEILAELGSPVDEDTLVADLDALGQQVDPVGEAAAGATGTADADDAFADVPERTERWRGDGTERPSRVVSAVVVLAVCLLVAAVLATGRDDEEDTFAGEADITTTTAVDAPSTMPEARPLGPGEDAELADGGDGATDFSTTTGEGLAGAAPGDLTWEVVGGRWEVDGEVARLDEVPADRPGLALLSLELDSYRAQVRLPELVANVGIAFWANPEGDGWMLLASPASATFLLTEVRLGHYEVIGSSGLTTTRDGAATVGVHVEGRRVEALVDGAVVIEHELAEDPPGRRVGMGSLPGAAGGTFDDFTYAAEP